MNNLVSDAQHAFVKGRKILDAILISNEAIDSLCRGRGGGIMCQLEFPRSHYEINVPWREVKKLGNAVHFYCSFYILINGSPVGFLRILGCNVRRPLIFIYICTCNGKVCVRWIFRRADLIDSW